MLGAEVLWGVGAPLGKAGATLLFWIFSLFTPREDVTPKDLLNIFFASLCGVVINQCCFV